jgi:hypothetical protein
MLFQGALVLRALQWWNFLEGAVSITTKHRLCLMLQHSAR